MSRRDGFLQSHPRLEAAFRALRPYTPPLNFITLHYAYFITICLLASLIFWGSSDPKFSISYTDSLFLVISAMTEAGLNTVNLSQMTSWQQVLLWLLIILGSAIWVSIWTVLARKHAFERRFKDIAQRSRLRSPKSLEKRRTDPTPLVRVFSRTFGQNKSLLGTSNVRKETDTRKVVVRNPATGSTMVLPISGPLAPHKLSEPVPKTSDNGVSTDISSNGLSEIVSPTDPTSRDHIAFANTDSSGGRGTTTGFGPGTGPSRRHATIPDDSKAESSAPPPLLSHRSFLTSNKIGRNAQFHDLSSEEREHLGGTEYRALKILALVVPLYFVAWQFLGCIALGAWIANNHPQPALDNAVGPWWNGIFNGISAFNNSGMSVLDANMIPYGSSYFVLVAMGAMTLAGNTAYPIFLRFWLWSALKLLNLIAHEESFGDIKLTLEYILKYPRRVYTNLFPARSTWWLLFTLVLLNGTDWVAFEILNVGNPALSGISTGSRVIDGLFQATAVRSGGFYVVSISTLYIGLQVLYVIMMYISVYPVVITIRHSNVYEERSLGIYAEDMETGSSRDSTTSISAATNEDATTTGTAPESTNFFARALRHTLSDWQGVGAAHRHQAESSVDFISQQVRGQLSHDLWWLVLAVLLITIIETSHFLEDPEAWSVFNIVFEVVSAYGCVGISVGVPNDAYSFSGGWYTGSKLVLCLVMLRGRHRGLPVALDRAVRLPGDELGRTEEEDHRIRRSMSMRRMSIDHRAD